MKTLYIKLEIVTIKKVKIPFFSCSVFEDKECRKQSIEYSKTFSTERERDQYLKSFEGKIKIIEQKEVSKPKVKPKVKPNIELKIEPKAKPKAKPKVEPKVKKKKSVVKKKSKK